MSLPRASVNGEDNRRMRAISESRPASPVARILVRNLEANERLARNNFDDTHADDGQRSCKVFREVRDLADFDARSRIQFKPSNDGARMTLT